MVETAVLPVILANAAGAEPWPSSRQSMPAALRPSEAGPSPLQASALLFAAASIVVCGPDHHVLVAEQLARVGATPLAVLVEDGRGGSGPAAIAAALVGAAAAPEALLLLFSCPAVPIDAGAIQRAVTAAAPSAQAGAIVALGAADGAPVVAALARPAALIEYSARQNPALTEACRQAVADARRDGPLIHIASAAYDALPPCGLDGVLPGLAAGSARIHRPWGWFHSIDRGERFQVKHIEVNPGAKLSLQKHWHRSEHWIVVAGAALVTNGDSTLVLRENQSTYIPAGTVHRLENPGKVPLRLIEVQSGDYVGEDDIVRLEDSYGR